MSTPLVKVDRVGKIFHDSSQHTTNAIKEVSLDINEGDFLTIFGPNGSGKTTLLNLVGKIENPTTGNVEYGKPNLRIGYVFQNYDESLLPWRTVEENINLPFENYSFKQNEAKSKIEKVIKLLRLEQYRDKYPYMLSGGKKQLTALARALVIEPDILIMDEPFSSLDFDTTTEMEQLVMEIWRDLNITVLFVSHDIDEAVLLANKVIVLSHKPSVVNKIIDVELDHPRNQETTVSPLFVEIKKQVIESYGKI